MIPNHIGWIVKYQNPATLKGFVQLFSQEIMCLDGGGRRDTTGEYKGWGEESRMRRREWLRTMLKK